MPIYEYICKNCSYEEEILCKVNDSKKQICPNCKTAMIKKISSPAIQFKGSGFYITDYKSQSKSEESNKGTPKKSSPKKKNLAS
jgi:putative FmdB family regulatory protein